MKLLFKQRFFSWMDSYDVYDENENAVFTVEGRLSFGHCLDIQNASGENVGRVKEEILTLLPRFALYDRENYIGEVKKAFTFFKPVFDLDCNGWQINGNFMAWDYEISDSYGQPVAWISKELFNFTDTYVLEIGNPDDALLVLMVALAIDAARCSSGS